MRFTQPTSFLRQVSVILELEGEASPKKKFHQVQTCFWVSAKQISVWYDFTLSSTEKVGTPTTCGKGWSTKAWWKWRDLNGHLVLLVSWSNLAVSVLIFPLLCLMRSCIRNESFTQVRKIKMVSKRSLMERSCLPQKMVGKIFCCQWTEMGNNSELLFVLCHLCICFLALRICDFQFSLCSRFRKRTNCELFDVLAVVFYEEQKCSCFSQDQIWTFVAVLTLHTAHPQVAESWNMGMWECGWSPSGVFEKKSPQVYKLLQRV